MPSATVSDRSSVTDTSVTDTVRITQTLSLAVLGAGAWGSALAQLAEYNGHRISVWSRRNGNALGDVVAGADMILSAISMKGVAALANQLKALSIPESVILVTATKGLDPQTTNTPSQIFQSVFPNNPVAVLSGPNLSKEIDQGLPAATVVASSDQAAAEKVQTLFSSDQFRVYTCPDPLGAELGGTLRTSWRSQWVFAMA